MVKSIIFVILFSVVLFANAEFTSTKLTKVEPKPGDKLIVTSSNGLHCRAKPCDGSKSKKTKQFC